MLLCVIWVVCHLFHTVASRCSRLPSGNCWVSCMETVYEVTCFDATAKEIQSDLERFAGTGQNISLNIWNSDKIPRLSADVFYGVEDQILALDLQDVRGLNTFPELIPLVNLDHFNLWNSPNLTDFSLELLPRNIRRLSLNRNGITHLEVDTIETPDFPKLTTLMLRNLTLKGWQKDFFRTFPVLHTLQIANCTLHISEDQDHFPVAKTVQNLTFASNKFILDTTDTNYTTSIFLTNLISSFIPLEDGSLDMSNNGIPITNFVVEHTGHLKNLSHLWVRGNPIVIDANVLSFAFSNLPMLETLDLGQTGILAVQGMFRGMPKLKVLLIDGNNLGNFIGDKNIFLGSTSYDLRILDVTGNNMTVLPSFTHVAGNIEILRLGNNNLKILESSSPVWTGFFSQFLSLGVLDLSSNNMETFYGKNLQGATQLKVLVLRCNNFSRITRQFLDGLPNSVQEINLSMCPSNKLVLEVEKDAFVKTPESLQILRMNSARLKRAIFSALNASAQGLQQLRELHLKDNLITYLHETNLPHLPNLELINLEGNRLQSVQKHTFGNLPSLKILTLARNRISVIGPDNLGWGGVSLQNLEILDFSDNTLYRIDRGSFDNLPKLKVLRIGYNPVDVRNLFATGGKELIYFGMENYNTSCLKPEFFQQLPKLKWIFPDYYNLVSVNPDVSLSKRDDLLLNMAHPCSEGMTIYDEGEYPGLGSFATATMYDSDDDGMPYPHMAAFLPKVYCPQAPYLQNVYRLICPPPDSLNEATR